MKIDYRNILYGDCIGTLEHIKKCINTNFCVSLEILESFLKSFCAELKLSCLSNENKKIILTYLLFNNTSLENHYWYNPSQKLTYEEWRNEQRQTTLECINILTRATERIELKENEGILFEDEEPFTEIGICYKYLREINLEAKTSFTDKQQLYEYFVDMVCSESLKLTKKTTTNS